MMMYDGDGFRDLGPLYRQLNRHFRARGVTSERKIQELTHRWLRQKGERFPNVACTGPGDSND
jgi:hypothetical protein